MLEKPRISPRNAPSCATARAGGRLRSVSAKTLVNTQCGLKFARSPRWIHQKLLFLDVHERCIKSADLDGVVQTVGALPYLPGCFSVLADGGMIVGDALGRKLYRWESDGSKQMADLSNIAKFCLGDGVVDNCGGMYVADVGFDFMDPLVDPVPNGVIAYISADGASSVVAENLYFPNGMIISIDNRTLIVAETLGHRLTSFAIEGDGSLNNRRVWAQLQDEVKPEGICLDSAGAVWVAGAGPRALHVREGGKIDQQVTSERPAFATTPGGPERRHLFLCTADSNDPVITRQVSCATIDIAEVEIPGI